MGQTRFIADPHFGHADILDFDDREFPDIAAHDSGIIKLWNEHVAPDDDVWILGDLSWHDPEGTVDILKRLSGRLFLCIGNHDHDLLKDAGVRSCFEEIVDYKELPLPDGKKVVLSHYPIPCFNDHYLGWSHLYGHVHSSFEWNMMEQHRYRMEKLYFKPCEMINAGCMLPYMEYYPLTLGEIKARYAVYKAGEAAKTGSAEEKKQ